MATKKKKPIKKKIIRKKITKKAIKKRPIRKVIKKAKPKLRAKAKKDIIGKVTHYFPHVRAAVVKLKVPLAVGAKIKIKGHTTDFSQIVDSMQIDLVPVNNAKKGDEIGLLVVSRVRQHDIVYKA